jgi:ABC-type phosphate transport system substrate-binding protein
MDTSIKKKILNIVHKQGYTDITIFSMINFVYNVPNPYLLYLSSSKLKKIYINDKSLLRSIKIKNIKK